MNYGVIAPGDHWILIRCATHHPYELKNLEPSAKYAPGAMRYVCVGAAISRPVVSSTGKQRRRIAPTMHHQTFANEIRRYNVETWYICNIGTFVRPNRFCSKIFHVGGRMISAPTRTVPPNDRRKYFGAPPCASKYLP